MRKTKPQLWQALPPRATSKPVEKGNVWSFFNTKSETLIQSIFEKAFSSLILGLVVLVLTKAVSKQYETYVETAEKRDALRAYTNDRLADLLPAITENFYELRCARKAQEVPGNVCNGDLSTFITFLSETRLQLVALFPSSDLKAFDKLIVTATDLYNIPNQEQNRNQINTKIDAYTASFGPAIREIAANFR
nr:hypothetical protein [uncultured Ruegeria sp.]